MKIKPMKGYMLLRPDEGFLEVDSGIVTHERVRLATVVDAGPPDHDAQGRIVVQQLRPGDRVIVGYTMPLVVPGGDWLVPTAAATAMVKED